MEVQVRENTTRLQAKESELQELHPRFLDTERALAQAQNKLTALEAERNAKNQQIKTLEEKVVRFTKQLSTTSRRIEMLVEWIEGLEHGISALLSSRRWKTGNRLGELRRRLLLKPRVTMPVDILSDVFGHFNAWKKNYQKEAKKPPDRMDKDKRPIPSESSASTRKTRGANELAAGLAKLDSSVTRRLPPEPIARASGPTPTDDTIVNPNWRSRIPLLEKLSSAGQGIHEEVPDEVVDYAKAIIAEAPPRISVIMPTWNRQSCVCRAIDSVLNQSFKPYEIIVSDDGSTDATVDTIRIAYAAEVRSGLIKIIENQHRGVSATRNAGMQAATGEIFSYLDTDNVWRKHFLLIMAAAFVESDELTTAYSALKLCDQDTGRETIRAAPFDRRRLLDLNFIDLNIFTHRRILFDQLSGFDETLNRLVDWEMIIRYTKHYEPAFFPFIGVDYFLNRNELRNITHFVPLDENRNKVLRRHFIERVQFGLDDLRIAYFIYDFPALSQTFVMNELRWLVEHGYDVKVYYAVSPDKQATLDFEVDVHRVKDAKELAELFRQHDRNICHSHFAYPGVTLFVWPACMETGIHYTFMPHAVDIFHHANRKRNRIGETANDPRCLKVFVYGDHHKNFLVEHGIPAHKIAYNFQAVDLSDFAAGVEKRQVDGNTRDDRPMHGLVFARLIEKKGIKYLLEAAKALEETRVEFHIYGYGPLEEDLKSLAGELGLSNVHFRGAVEGREQIARLYEEADFLVAPCVETENGDVDGFPTVILEAMAAGIPLITTTVSAIPDYLRDGVEAILVPPADVDALRRAIERVLDMPPPRRRALVKGARNFLDKRVGVDKTMEMLLDIWSGYSVDLMLVTHNTEKYEDREETYEIVRRLLSHTTTSFTLTVIDNASDREFWERLVDVVRGNPSVRLIRKRTNQYLGPAANIAMIRGSAEFIIYVCSKEGFIKEHGWERTLIRYMRTHPEIAMAGHKVHLPRFTYGKELMHHLDFRNFRNQNFALSNPNRSFRHVQGGIFIARRATMLENGGFNPAMPQSNMDVEMSYFLESQGYQLGEIPELASVTTKTLPRLVSILDETTVAAHPLTLANVGADLDALKERGLRRCNICGWQGPAFRAGGDPAAGDMCPSCQSTPFGRLIFRIMANDHRAHRDAGCAILSRDVGLATALGERMFRVEVHESTAQAFVAGLKRVKKSLACIIVDHADVGGGIMLELWKAATASLDLDGEILFSDTSFDKVLSSHVRSRNVSMAILSGIDFDTSQFALDYVDISSDRIGFDWRRVGRLVKVKAPPRCNVCEGTTFGLGPNGSRSLNGRLPRCCGREKRQ